MRALSFGTYLYLREDGTPYYVGKFSRLQRVFNKRHGVPVPKDRSRIIVQYFLTHDDAVFAEQFLIAYYGRKDIGTGILRNLTDGGEGPLGRVVTDKQRAALRLGAKTGALKQFTSSSDHQRRAGLAAKAQRKGVWSPNYDLSATNRGRRASESTRHLLRMRMLGTTHAVSPETRAKISAAKKGKTPVFNGIRCDNASGVKGVCWDNTKRRWLATFRGKYIGRFENKEAAVDARKAAEQGLSCQ